ncbi:RNA-binding protein [Bradyrhizobium arachidis]|uniref:RNA-binding protein n=1 Tax=Bradyrhizobium TaxID=374 RepID=UPI00188A5D9A|nr:MULTISPECIES: RNA-binding protein [Bradyrhizobium]QOZ53362.1 RNA-binding protein [Bradyrhizobium sp. CCBAU 53338]UVO33776.1 RNA-binding protein [Bradyrhizobium arachidis]
MNFREPTETNEQAAGQGDVVSQIDTTEKLSEVVAPRTSLFALFWLGVAAIAMMGWICALGWLAWHLVDWLLS